MFMKLLCIISNFGITILQFVSYSKGIRVKVVCAKTEFYLEKVYLTTRLNCFVHMASRLILQDDNCSKACDMCFFEPMEKQLWR